VGIIAARHDLVPMVAGFDAPQFHDIHPLGAATRNVGNPRGGRTHHPCY
jgi:hypothetical protein